MNSPATIGRSRTGPTHTSSCRAISCVVTLTPASTRPRTPVSIAIPLITATLRVMTHPSFDRAALARARPTGADVIREGLAARLESLARRRRIAPGSEAAAARLLVSLAQRLGPARPSPPAPTRRLPRPACWSWSISFGKASGPAAGREARRNELRQKRAGRPHPTDPSRFTIEYETNAKRGVYDGRVVDRTEPGELTVDGSIAVTTSCTSAIFSPSSKRHIQAGEVMAKRGKKAAESPAPSAERVVVQETTPRPTFSRSAPKLRRSTYGLATASSICSPAASTTALARPSKS